MKNSALGLLFLSVALAAPAARAQVCTEFSAQIILKVESVRVLDERSCLLEVSADTERAYIGSSYVCALGAGEIISSGVIVRTEDLSGTMKFCSYLPGDLVSGIVYQPSGERNIYLD